MTQRLNQQDTITCPYATANGNDRHLLGKCEDCDVVFRLAAIGSLAAVESQYREGYISEDDVQAVTFAWKVASPLGDKQPPASPAVARVTAKVLTARGATVPAELNAAVA